MSAPSRRNPRPAEGNEMPNATPRRFSRLPDVCERLRIGRTTVYRWGQEGRFPRPVRLGANTAAWPDDEIDAVLAARAAGADDAAVRALVARLHAERSAGAA